MPRGPLYTNLLKSAASPFNKHAISILVYYNASCIVILADQVFKKVVILSNLHRAAVKFRQPLLRHQLLNIHSPTVNIDDQHNLALSLIYDSLYLLIHKLPIDGN